MHDVDEVFPELSRYSQPRAKWQSIEQDWRGHRASPEELSKRIFDVVGSVGSASDLVLDSEPASYYLMDTVVDQTPAVLANLGDGLASNAQFPSGQAPGIGTMLQIADTRTRVSAARQSISNDLREAWGADPRIKLALSDPANKLEEAHRRYDVAVKMRIVVDAACGIWRRDVTEPRPAQSRRVVPDSRSALSRPH